MKTKRFLFLLAVVARSLLFFLSFTACSHFSLYLSILVFSPCTLAPFPFPSQCWSSIPSLTLGLFRPSVCPSLDGFRLLSWWGWWPVWRLGCLVSRVIRADVALRGRSELSASASPRVTFHGQLVSEQRRARRLSAPLIVKISGNQSLLSSVHSLLRFFHMSASNPHSLFPLSLFVASLSLWVFPWCAFAALWLMVAVLQYVFWLPSSPALRLICHFSWTKSKEGYEDSPQSKVPSSPLMSLFHPLFHLLPFFFFAICA